MKVEMIMPQMGESIAEATVLKWLKNVGDKIQKDETILEISTDKVDSEIPAPATGTLLEISAKVGETVPVKSVIAIIETDTNAVVPPKKVEEKKSTKPSESPAPAKPTPTPQPTTIADDTNVVPPHIGERFFSPLVRSLATQHGLSTAELSRIVGSGAQGRVTKEDVLNFLDSRRSSPPTATKASAPQKSSLPTPPRPDFGADGIRVEPMDNIRKRIAEHMVRSKATSAHVYSVAEVDVTNLARWREQKQPSFLEREGFKLSFTPFFLEAVTRALIQFPYINASVDGDNIILKRDIHLGCAVALGTTGLVVPVIRNADLLTLTGIARALQDLAVRARSKKLSPDDLQGGTFTVTNPGTFGNIIGYPIINQPQVGIVGVGAIKKRPMIVNDAIAIRDIVYLTLTYDHRIIDGSLGGSFLQFVAKYLENWDMQREVF